MTVRIAINGLGRIGRCVLRAITEYERDDVEVVAVNGPADIEQHLHLLKYDSIHGTFPQVKRIGNNIDMGRGEIKLFQLRDPLQLPWKELDIDIVMECTGVFNKRDKAAMHLQAGAKKVMISAPADDADATIVYGVNNDVLKPEHKVISIGSCTTNCLAPVAKVLNDNIGIERGFMTTVHAFTNDQNVLDGSHKDLQRARTASMSMIPTSTGAAKALGLVLPELSGKLDGCAVRVPTPNVSMVDLTFDAGKNTSVDEVNSLIKTASENQLKGVLGYNDEPLVSIDYNHNPHSSIFDARGTKVIDKKFVRISSWYDNEWGFSVRMIDVAKLFANL
ncbi:MAG: type I glyceraldehyde-3-phosphate dehydrogenase [Rickettsiales bacterium]|nr:type I glyceraldehyde-3-phosphate dehydrogenase [Pseudomonadota bacterium]MDA0966340.1 type I glyceraldehyde-3-phosphate dehydrogenase [Pseudomonadota bacterium]MDG4543972.1 type I glyceraldehyde-3-phosphate dehydrogenase [Rickettsiales bacterium]MDG4545466.1 type I glyceraldehyde-3-phosphate dehydrogenase [Rickettsiales bacterium]MDG4547915.1 type I glyceraldehyde-3-phosphate dehydrogenase [Rickettsiales bacterium]